MEVQKVDLECGDITMRMSFQEAYMICSSVEKLYNEFKKVEKKNGLKEAVGYLLSHYGGKIRPKYWYQDVKEKKAFEELTDDMCDAGNNIFDIMLYGLIE